MNNYYITLKEALLNGKTKKWAKAIAGNVNTKARFYGRILVDNKDYKNRGIFFHYNDISGLSARDSKNNNYIRDIIRLGKDTIDHKAIKVLVPLYYNGQDKLIDSLSNRLHGNMGRCFLTWNELAKLGIVNGDKLSPPAFALILLLIAKRYNVYYGRADMILLLCHKGYIKWFYTIFLLWIKFTKRMHIDMLEEIAVEFYLMAKKKELSEK